MTVEEIERRDALQAIALFLQAQPFCKGAIMVTFHSGRRHIVSAESGRFPELNGLAGFPATDIHEKMMMSDGMYDRLVPLGDEIAEAIGRNVDQISKAAVQNIGKVVANCLMRAAKIDIPEQLN
jgi:hypothetical protein